jgi:hypothetical protein
MLRSNLHELIPLKPCALHAQRWMRTIATESSESISTLCSATTHSKIYFRRAASLRRLHGACNNLTVCPGPVRQEAANAVRARIDWKYLLGLELTEPGFDFSILSRFRDRLIEGNAEMLLLRQILNMSQSLD